MKAIKTKIAATNFSAGRNGFKPEAIVIHIMDGSLAGTDSWFADAKSGVSSHYGIGKTGEVHQYVEESDTAFHAGVVDKPSWKLLLPGKNPNLYTIGIEHEGKPLVSDVWPVAMKLTSATLIAEIAKRWGIPLDREHIIGHYEIRASKPNCPALNKGIIDELIIMAKAVSTDGKTDVSEPSADDIKKDVAKAYALIEQGQAILKKYA